MKRVLILDNNNLLYRIYHVTKLNEPTLNSAGENINNLNVFLMCVKSYIKTFAPDVIYGAWDKKLTYPSTNFRKKLKEGSYKANRDKTDVYDIHKDEEAISELLTALGIKCIYPNVLEGDDVIYYLSTKHKDDKVTIVTADQDLCQLVDHNTNVFLPIKKELITLETFESKFKLRREDFLKYKVIKGDASDNIKGLEGYGEVKSRKFISNWDENLKSLTDEQRQVISENFDMMNISRGVEIELEELPVYEKQFEAKKDLKPDWTYFEMLCTNHGLMDHVKYMYNWKALFTKKVNMPKTVSSLISRLQ